MKRFFKQIMLAACCLLAGGLLTGCDEDSDVNVSDFVPGREGAYVVNQGNFYGGVTGTMSYLNFADGSVTGNAFFNANSQHLGDTPQAPVRYGSKIYIPVFESQKLAVLDAATLSLLKMVDVAHPEAVCGSGRYVYVASNDGHVTRVDTLLYDTSDPLPVGPNPAGITAAGGHLYVSISDGYNYANNYANGLRVAVINEATFTKTGDIPVGLNPGQVQADMAGNVFVLCRGNYADVTPKVMRIAAGSTSAADFCEGSLMAVSYNTLYVADVKADYATNTAAVTMKAFDSRQSEAHELQDFAMSQLPAMPQAIDVNPLNGDLFVCSDKGPLDYDKEGLVYQYSATGTLKATYNVGIHPYGVAFK